MFMGLSMRDKLSVFTEDVPVTKGKKFYRIRKIGGIKDPSNPKEWAPVPVQSAKQGRFNEKGKSVLYVASDTFALEREVRLHEGDEYYLAMYTCKNSFKVGSFLGVYNQVNTLIHKITMAVSGPNDMTDAENKLMAEYYEKATDKDLFELSVDMLASLYIYKMFPKLYNTTNKLAKLVLKKNECGIRYSSVFAPIELSGAPQIVTLDGTETGNYVLTQKGYENISLTSVEKKVCGKPMELDLLIKTIAEA